MPNYVSTYILITLGVFVLWIIFDLIFVHVRTRSWMRRKWNDDDMYRHDGRYWVSSKPEEPKREPIKENV